ncbi:MAG: hypothetical protein JNM67_13300 [Bacteroidetes bacterium]|nr:hypothetical protein [Bacteroidota bacterium]
MNRKTFWIIVAGLHAIFMLKQLFINNSMLQDSVEYLFAADNLIQHQTLYAWNYNFAHNADWLTKRPFLYPSILVLFKTMSFNHTFVFFFLVYFVQNLISLNSIRLVLKLADQFNPGYRYLHVLFFLLFSVSQLIYANFIMCEIWLQAAFTLITYTLLTSKHSVKKYLSISLLICAAMALKPVAMPAAFIYPIALIIGFKFRPKLPHLLLSLIPLVFAFTTSVINEKRTGFRQYSSISTINLLHYNTYVMLMNQYGTTKADSIIDNIKLETRSLSYKDRQSYIDSTCTEIIKNHLPLYTYLHLRGIAFALIDPGRFDFTQFFNLAHSSNLIYQTNQKGSLNKIIQSFYNPLGLLLILILLFNVFRFLKALHFMVQKRYNLTFKMLVLAIPAYILTLTGPIGSSRFFMPLIPIALLIFLLSLRNQNTK